MIAAPASTCCLAACFNSGCHAFETIDSCNLIHQNGCTCGAGNRKAVLNQLRPGADRFTAGENSVKRRASLICSLLLFAQASGLFACSAAFADDAPAAQESTTKQISEGRLSPAQLYKQTSPTVFPVQTQNEAGQPVGTGSCVVVGKHEVVTNKHVVLAGARTVIKGPGGKMLPAEITHVCPDEDLVLLKVAELEAPVASVRSCKSLEVGEQVYAIGSPWSLEESLSEGLLSGLRPKGEYCYIQTTAQILPGSSGGGLFDQNGKLIGITSVNISNAFAFSMPADLIAVMRNHAVSETQKLSDPKFRAKLAFDTALGYNKFSRNQPVGLKGKFIGIVGEHLELAMKLDPENGEYPFALGQMCNVLGLYDRAIPYLERSAKVGPKASGQALTELTAVYMNKKQPEKALETYDRLAKVDQEWAKKVAALLMKENIDVNAPRKVATSEPGPGTGSPSDSALVTKNFVAYVVSSVKKSMRERPLKKLTERCDVGLVFRIAADGTVSNIKVAASCGNVEIDEHAKIALVTAAPFTWVPKEVLGKNNYVDMKIVLDYNPHP